MGIEFIIHACPARLDYVNTCLVPSIEDIGIHRESILIFNDENGIGCLESFIRSCAFIKEAIGPYGGLWHLQDDVILSNRFASFRMNHPDLQNVVVNGFVHKAFNPKEYRLIGLQPVKNYWMSFPCIYIPNRLICEFYDWFNEEVIVKGKYARYYYANKYDDFFFWTFMKMRHGNEVIYNCAPNLVNHIDYLLGGSQINEHHAERTLAYYWDEPIPEKI